MRKLDLTKNETGFFQGTKKPVFSKATSWPLLLLLMLILMSGIAEAQAPTLSYPGPKIYQQGQAASLAPVSSGVGSFGYGTTATQYGSGYTHPSNVATDAAGDVYIADFNYGVIKIPAGNGAPVYLNTGYGSPTSIAIDAAGNLYVAAQTYTSTIENPDYYYYTGYVGELPAGQSTPIELKDEGSELYSVAADPAGNLFITGLAVYDDGSYGPTDLYERAAGGSSFKTLYEDDSSNSSIGDLACDAAGDVFFNDFDGGLFEISVAGSVPDSVGVISNSVTGITIDAAGNFYEIEGQTGLLEMVPAGSRTPVVIGPAFSYPSGVAVDGAGNVYVSANYNYNISAPPGSVSQLKPTGGYFITPALPAGLSFDNHTGIISGTPTAASPATIYTITAYNSSGSTMATVSIKISPGAYNDNLAALKLSHGVLSPAFSATTTSYTTTVANGVTSIQLTPVTETPNENVKINGTAVADSAVSAPIPLAAGTDTVNVVITSPNGLATKTYLLLVTRQGNNNDNLLSLKVSRGALTPVFAATTTSYTENVANGVRSMTVTPTTSDPDATIKVNGAAVASGATSTPVALSVGSTTINIVITASNGTSTKTYTITVTRPASGNDNLSSLNLSAGTLSPAFVASTTGYTVNEINAVRSITVTPTAGDPDATIKVNGKTVASGAASTPIALHVGSTAISVGVTASDGVTAKTYTLTVSRAASSNDSLSSITITGGTLSPAFASAITSYSADVKSTTASTTVKPTAVDPDATVKVNGTTVPSGSALAIALNVGSNTINVAVTASDGITSQTYTLTVNRENAATNDNLSYLSATAGALSPAFSPAITSYTVNTLSGATFTQLDAFTADTNATVTINGVPDTVRGNSPAYNLSYGSNIFNVVVTAEDGITSKTYTVNVIRPLSNNANLASLKISKGALSPAFTGANTSYTASVVNGVSSVMITPTTPYNTGATVTVNGTAVPSGSASGAIPLNVGADTVTTVVTAQDGITTKTYTIVFTRAAPPVNTPDESLSVVAPVEKPAMDDDAIVVHQAVSPNGDGVNDFLMIDGVQAYPDNKLTIMNRSGQLIYEAKGYDNTSKVFDGHSSKNGQMQLPGTYFYQLDYTVKGIIKHKTGYLVLKY